LRNYFDSLATRMAAEIEEAKHAGPSLEIGTRRKEALRNFLQHYLPRWCFVGPGIIVSGKARSEQQDLVIFDEFNYPRLPQTDVGSIFLVEGVIGCIQVKSTLSRDELGRAINNILTAKALTRRMAYRPFGIIFAFECPSPKDRKKELAARNQVYMDPYLIIDRVYVSNSMVMGYQDKKRNAQRLGMREDEVFGLKLDKATMLHFYDYVLKQMVPVPHESFNIYDYIGDYFEQVEAVPF
jgi:hypothetical protein